jgi:TonB family protein
MKPFALAHPRCHSRTNNKSVIYRLSIRLCGTPDAYLRVRSWVVPVFLNRLQSGFLLFETQHGLVRVELSLWQRIYLLWTFRNFRQLSIPLLNPRQRTLVNALFRNSAGVASHSHNPLPVIGVVENFVPPTVRIDASPAQKKERQEKVVPKRAEVEPKPDSVRSSSPKFAWPTLASTVAVLSLCIISVVVWHRIQAIPASQAHNQPRLQQINGIAVPNSPQSAKPATIVESPTAIGPSSATAQFLTAPGAAVVPASIATVIPTAKRAIRVHDAASTPNNPLSGQDNGIQASRPPLRFVYPVYPDVRARGVVSLTAGLGSDGAVRTVRVVSGNRALAPAAVRAVRQWRYRPYLKDGQPVATETSIVISFFSDDAISISFPPSIPAIH